MDKPGTIRSRPLRRYLIIIYALTTLPAMLVLGLLAARHLEWAREHVHDHVRIAAQSAASAQENATGQMRGILEALAQIAPLRRADPWTAGRILARIVNKSPDFASLALFSLSGEVIASAGQPLPEGLNERGFFRNVLATGSFSAGRAERAAGTNSAILPFAAPVQDEDGAITGVLAGGLKLSAPELRAGADFARQGLRVLLLSRDGQIVASFPSPGEAHDPFALPPPGERSYPTNGDKGLWLGSGPGGATWVFAEQDITLSPSEPGFLRVVAGMPEEAALEPLLTKFRRDFIILGIVPLVALLVAYLVGDAAIVRKLARLSEAAERIAGGDLQARAGLEAAPAEIARLGESFDRMVSALEHRESNRREIVAALRASRKRFKDVAASVADWIWEVDRDGRVVFVSGRVGDVLGFTPAEMRGAMLSGFMIPGEQERLHAIFQQQLDDRLPQTDLEMWQLTADGRKICQRMVSIPLLDKQGGVTGFRGVCVDVTAQKLAEQSMLRSLSEKEILLKEVHHRVKNNLQIITSLMNLQSQAFDDMPQVEEAFSQMRGRVRSIALIHERLYSTGDFSAVEMGGYIRSLAEHVKFAHELPGRQVSLDYELAPLTLPLDQALPVSLILNECLTNAFKHGLDGQGAGMVRVRLVRDGDGVALTVQDNGRGFPPSVLEGTRTGLGFQLIEALASQIGGDVEFSNAPGGGASIRVSFPPAIV